MNMRAKLKNVIAYHIGDDLPNYIPDDVENVGIWFDLMIGPDGADGNESFQVFVCTPKWLSANHNKDDIVVGRPNLIIFEYDYDRLVHQLHTIINQYTGDNWPEIGEKLTRLGYWEFEDYDDTPIDI